MTIKDRIELLKAGYTKEEIKEIAEEEKQVPQPAPAPETPEAPQDAPKWAADLTKSINNFVDTVHANNIIASGDGPEVPQMTNVDILGSLIRGDKK